MSYWQEVKDVFKKGVEMAGDGLQKGVEMAGEGFQKGVGLAGEGINKGKDVVMEKTKTGVTLLQLKKLLWSKQKEYRKSLTELGDMAFDLFKVGDTMISSPAFKTRFDRTEGLEKECKALELEIKEASGK